MNGLGLGLLCASALLQDSSNPMPEVLPLRQRAELRDAWLLERLDSVVPALLARERIDMWVVAAREYNEDPVIETMLPATWMSARRRTILVFHQPPDGELEKLSVARYDLDPFYERVWDKEEQPDQWARLAEVIAEREPRTIAIDVSATAALADGLSASERDALLAALPNEYAERIVSAEGLAVGWLETRIPAEMELYDDLCRIAHRIIAEGFTAAVVQPGRTTTEDVEWWYRERIRELRIGEWFHPSVSLQRNDGGTGPGTFAAHPGKRVIQRGDLLHVDLGITYLGLNTDTQQHAYVLREDETEPPPGLTRALAVGNRLQDILMGHFAAGRTGNEILELALEQAAGEGIEAIIYSHPLGFHGHGAGPLIGLWDQQGGVPGRGDFLLHANTAWSIELQARVNVAEWADRTTAIMLEEDAFFDTESVQFIDGRQTELIVIAPSDG